MKYANNQGVSQVSASYTQAVGSIAGPRFPLALSCAARGIHPLLVSALLGGLLFSACSDEDSTALAPATNRSQLTGEQLFKLPFPGAGNERSCATCHVPEDNFALTADHVERVYADNPSDPLFSAIDADDPTAEPLTFDHLKKGLVRVWITLPDNVDTIDESGEVVTPTDRKIFVWRGVPSIADVAITAPYQLDGREATLETQAQGAITSHSEGAAAPWNELERIAEFERNTFTSERAARIASRLQDGQDSGELADAENDLELTEEESRGREVFLATCAGCHGGPSMTTVADRKVHDLSFPDLYTSAETPEPLSVDNSDNEFINIGSALENFLVQLGAAEHESFTKNLSYPGYRLRFYTDASRQVATIDLPASTEGFFDGGADGFDEGNNGLNDENGVNGAPTAFPQLYSTDPGRALITGNPYDFEGFDIPTLRGISRTAPYWHNSISKTLEDVVELYSDHLLIKYPPLILEGEKEIDEDGDIGDVGEAFTRQHKNDLVAYLKRL